MSNKNIENLKQELANVDYNLQNSYLNEKERKKLIEERNKLEKELGVQVVS